MLMDASRYRKEAQDVSDLSKPRYEVRCYRAQVSVEQPVQKKAINPTLIS